MSVLEEAYNGIDVAKLRNAVAVADAGRDGEVWYIGEVDASPERMRRLVAKLASKYDQLHFCYAAGPTWYLRCPIPPSPLGHPISLRLDLSQKSRLLFGRPLPTPLDPPDDLALSHASLLLELQNESPADGRITDRKRYCYTW